MSDSKSVLFICPYPRGKAPSQRFRFEQYLSILTSRGYSFDIKPFFDDGAWMVLYHKGKAFRKTIATVRGFMRRFSLLFFVHRYQFIFIHREATPIGPPWFEWIIAILFRKKLIYDIDDAIWSTDVGSESFVTTFLKWRNKVGSISHWAYMVSCGNDYLCDYAKRFNKNVVLNPTTIDTEFLHNPHLHKKPREDGRINIGWTGSHSTLKYLNSLEAVLGEVEDEFPSVQIIVIADQQPSLRLKSLCYVRWNEETEIEDLSRVDIGIMPLPDDEWTKGKCGFKALQYMALKIPTVASPVGVNTKIVDENINGFLCPTQEEWKNALVSLIQDAQLRKSMGENGRLKVIDHYSVSSNTSTFLSLLE